MRNWSIVVIAGIGLMMGTLGNSSSRAEGAAGSPHDVLVASPPQEASPFQEAVQIDEAQLQALIESLKQVNGRRAKDEIVQMGQPAVPLLLAALNEREVVQTQQILETLGRIGDERAMKPVSELLNSRSEWIRCAAVYALAEIGGKKATPLLVNCLDDKNSRVCEILIQTLAKIDDPRAIPGLIDTLRNPDREISQYAAAALVHLTGGATDYGTDWMSWHLWYETEQELNPQSTQTDEALTE